MASDTKELKIGSSNPFSGDLKSHDDMTFFLSCLGGGGGEKIVVER